MNDRFAIVSLAVLESPAWRLIGVGAMRTYLALAAFANRERMACPGLDTLADLVGCAPRNAQAHLKALEERGLIRRLSRGRRGHAAEWQLTKPDPRGSSNPGIKPDPRPSPFDDGKDDPRPSPYEARKGDGFDPDRVMVLDTKGDGFGPIAGPTGVTPTVEQKQQQQQQSDAAAAALGFGVGHRQVGQWERDGIFEGVSASAIGVLWNDCQNRGGVTNPVGLLVARINDGDHRRVKTGDDIWDDAEDLTPEEADKLLVDAKDDEEYAEFLACTAGIAASIPQDEYERHAEAIRAKAPEIGDKALVDAIGRHAIIERGRSIGPQAAKTILFELDLGRVEAMSDDQAQQATREFIAGQSKHCPTLHEAYPGSGRPSRMVAGRVGEWLRKREAEGAAT